MKKLLKLIYTYFESRRLQANTKRHMLDKASTYEAPRYTHEEACDRMHEISRR